MSDDPDIVSAGFRKWLASLAKTLSSATIVVGVIWFMAKPVLDPYLEIPEKLDGAIEDINMLDAKVSTQKKLEFLSFKGNGIVTSNDGHTLEFLYLLNRKVSCEAVLTVRYWDIDRGYFTYVAESTAVKSPVSETFMPFKFSMQVPATLKPGRYSYIPTLRPIDCGVYGPVVVPPSDIFTIENRTMAKP